MAHYIVYLLGWNIKGNCSEIHFFVCVDTGHDEEETRAFGAPRSQATKAENNSSLVLLDNLEHRQTVKIIYCSMSPRIRFLHSGHS